MQQTTNVAESKQPPQHAIAWFAIFFAEQLWYVIWANGAAEANLSVGANCLSHICWATVVEGLGKRLGRAFRVAKVNVLYVLAQSPYRVWNIDTHGCKSSLAKTNCVAWTGNQGHQSLKCRYAIHNARPA